jgi:hypothetical protein
MLRDLGRLFITDVSGPLKTESLGCPETSVANYKSTPRNIPEQRKPELPRWKPEITNKNWCTNYFIQRMHYLLKRKILQFVFMCFFYIAPTCFGPIGPSSGSTYQNLAKVAKITVSLKYQLKRFVKIVVAWRMEGSACGVCSGCSVVCVTHIRTLLKLLKLQFL